nr:retrovirus-related Pol polyprotein from transposon TNT 1-94 [Tanacetum cinerariifolium]
MLCRPRPNSNELKRVAIGYKNPLCLTRAKKVLPALYNGHEIIKDNHTPAIVHNSEDTLEIAEITRKKMNDKMNDPECVSRKALTKEVKEMKDVFEELEAEVAQYAVDKKHDAIKLKNLLITNDNLITECLSQEVFCVATNFELNVARFTEMLAANTTAETRCLALEAELANLLSARDKHAIDVEPIVPCLRNNRNAHLDYLRHLKESVETIHDIVEEAKFVRPLDRSIVSAHRYTKHFQELLEYAIGTYPQGSQPRAKQLVHILSLGRSKITPSAITDGERGFEQTKACYLQEVIPFFKTLKDNFKGIQKALTKEVKEMKDVFEELEAELNVARFTEMLAANTTAETRCLALEAELANLRETNNQDNQKELINHFSKLEVTHLQAQNDLFRAKNDKIKQHYKELYDSIKITRAKHIEQEAKVVRPLDRSIVSACRYTKHSQE